MGKTSLPLSSRNISRLLVSSKFSVPSIFFLYPNTPPSYFTLTVVGAGGGAGILDEGSFESCVVDRGRCAMTLNAIAPTSTMAIAKRFGLRMGSSILRGIDFMFRRERDLSSYQIQLAARSAKLGISKRVTCRFQLILHEGIDNAVLRVAKDSCRLRF